MSTYTITIPEQTIKIDAFSKREAIERLQEDKLFKFDISQGTWSFPIEKRPSVYYIDRFYESISPVHWAYKSFSKIDRNYIFTDGSRIYSAADEYLNDCYTDITSSMHDKIAILTDTIAQDENSTKIKIDMFKLKSLCIHTATYGTAPRYSIKIRDVVHCINARYLLDALMYADTDEVEVSIDKCGKFRIAGDNNRTVVILPLNYTDEELREISIDQEM